MRTHHLFDIVTLCEASLTRYPRLKDACGTIVDFEGDLAYWVEFADDDGVTLVLDVFDENELLFTTPIVKAVSV